MSDSASFRPLRTPPEGSPAASPTAQVEPRLSRTNYFNGRLLTAEDLNRDHAYLDGRLLDIGLAGGDGVIAGFELRLEANRTRLSLGNGAGVAPSGRMLLLDRPADRPLRADLADLGRLATLNGNRVRGLGTALHAVVLMHREIGTDVAEVFPRDLGARRESSFNTISEVLEIALVPLPIRPPGGTELAARAALARSLLGHPELVAALPEEGLALGLLATEGGQAKWLDPFLLRRIRRDRADPAGPQRDLSAQYEALLDDVIADRAARALPPAFRAADAFALLPPAGTVPRAAFDPAAGSQMFFGEAAEVWVAPVRADEVAVLREESLAYGPIDLASGEPFDVVVLAPLSPQDFATYGRALQQPRSFAMSDNLPPAFRWPDGIGLPRIDPLRLRLLPQPGAGLDTDTGTWAAIWDRVPARLPYVRRPRHGGATGISAVMLAAGFSVPAPAPPDPTDYTDLARGQAAALANAQAEAAAARQEAEAAKAEAEQAKAALEQAKAEAGDAAGAAQQIAALTAERDQAQAEAKDLQAKLEECAKRTANRDDIIEQLRKRLVRIRQPPFPWIPDWADDPRRREQILSDIDGLIEERDMRLAEATKELGEVRLALDTASAQRDGYRTQVSDANALLIDLQKQNAALLQERNASLSILRADLKPEEAVLQISKTFGTAWR